jgi:D-alanyl-D-alanine carboxypeptidase
MTVDPSSIYNATDFSAARPAVISTITPDEATARLLYDKTVPEAQQREAKTALKEATPHTARLGEGTAVGDDRKSQPAPQSNENGAKPGEAPFKTQAEIAAVAEQLTTDLKLDTSDPAAQPFATVAAEIGLDKARAEKLVEFDRQRSETYWGALSDQWAAQSKREFSDADMAGARSMVRRFGDAELSELLAGPYGNNPAIARLLVKASRAIR